MPTVVGTVNPVALEWLGIGQERYAPGTVAAPTATLPVEKIEPDDKLTLLYDQTLRGMMATNFSATGGTESADVGFGGPVYLDTIGHVLLNLFGDYSTTGSSPTSATTTSAIAAAGATTLTVTSIAGYSNGSIVQVGSGATAEVVVLSIAPSGSTFTFTNNPLRFAHASGAALAIVAAPFTHTFSLLNAGNNGQPQTHTLTHYNGLTGANKAAQYAYWCAESCAFNMDPEKLFTHETKGQSYLQQAAGSPVTNAFSSVPVYANWQFAVGIQGPATGGTKINDLTALSVNIEREVKPRFTASGQQAPYVISRNALKVTGKFTEVAQSSTPMTLYLANTQPQLQFLATNGLSGANLLAITFNLQVAAIETVKFVNNQEIEYETSFLGLSNPTNAGGSGGQSPASVVIQNAVPTY
jgi:hypothetical protein